jgi:hypothetical protein
VRPITRDRTAIIGRKLFVGSFMKRIDVVYLRKYTIRFFGVYKR